MASDLPQAAIVQLPAYLVLAVLIALPSIAALRGRRHCRVQSEFATELARFAAAVRRERRCLPLDDVLLARARDLGMPELIVFEYLREIARPDPGLLADTAQRLALRLKRRVAFTRKMLARTASGRRRAALVATIPACVLLILAAWGVAIPANAIVLLLLLEALGCWLLWYLVRAGV